MAGVQPWSTSVRMSVSMCEYHGGDEEATLSVECPSGEEQEETEQIHSHRSKIVPSMQTR